MNIHPNTTLTALILALVVMLTNIGLTYFGIIGTVSCAITNAAPQLQAAAASAVKP